MSSLASFNLFVFPVEGLQCVSLCVTIDIVLVCSTVPNGVGVMLLLRVPGCWTWFAVVRRLCATSVY